jgi:hypothetical protein
LIQSAKNPNEQLLLAAVEKLAPLLEQIVFLGGCATGFLITDPAAAPIRSTLDVDVITELAAASDCDRYAADADALIAAASYAELLKVEGQIRKLGFRESQEKDAPRCRWVSDDLILDLMPTDPAILGFSNRWYRPALQNSQKMRIGEHEIRLVTAPYFLATKLEAFHGRGKNDYQMSHDLEDIVTVIDGRPELAGEVSAAAAELRNYLRDEFRKLLAVSAFRDALYGHLLPDAASQQRVPLIIRRIQRMIED